MCGLVLDDLGDLDVRDGYNCQSAASPWFPNAIIAPSPLDRCATKASGRDQTGRVGRRTGRILPLAVLEEGLDLVDLLRHFGGV